MINVLDKVVKYNTFIVMFGLEAMEASHTRLLIDGLTSTKMSDLTEQLAHTLSEPDHNTTPSSRPASSTQYSLPLIGYPGPVFYMIHITAISSLSISVLFSGGVLIYLLFINKTKFWTRPIAERLVVYLSLADLFHR